MFSSRNWLFRDNANDDSQKQYQKRKLNKKWHYHFFEFLTISNKHIYLNTKIQMSLSSEKYVYLPTFHHRSCYYGLLDGFHRYYLREVHRIEWIVMLQATVSVTSYAPERVVWWLGAFVLYSSLVFSNTQKFTEEKHSAGILDYSSNVMICCFELPVDVFVFEKLILLERAQRWDPFFKKHLFKEIKKEFNYANSSVPRKTTFVIPTPKVAYLVIPLVEHSTCMHN